MKQLGEILRLATHYLEKWGVVNPRLNAEELLVHALNLSSDSQGAKMRRLDLYMRFECPLDEKEIEIFRQLLKRRAKKEPLQYILEEISFYTCSIAVTSDVLIPRQESEILLDKMCTLLKPLPLHQKIAWDIGTGSGALAIGLKKTLPNIQVYASDLSQKALAIALKNSQRNDMDITFYQGDFLAPFQNQKADVVICNPPYVSEVEYALLEPEVRDFEPRMALVGGLSGLEFYERLAKELPSYLNPGAKVFLEIGKGQGEALQTIFKSHFWKSKSLEKDWAGLDRFFFLECE